MRRLYTALREVVPAESSQDGFAERTTFLNVMRDDLNTPEALIVLFDYARQLAANLRYLAGTIDLLQSEPSAFLHAGLSQAQAVEIETLIALRKQARADKDWAGADAALDKMAAMGVEVEDSPDGTLWRVGGK